VSPPGKSAPATPPFLIIVLLCCPVGDSPGGEGVFGTGIDPDQPQKFHLCEILRLTRKCVLNALPAAAAAEIRRLRVVAKV
jgi:hypothetical protein